MSNFNLFDDLAEVVRYHRKKSGLNRIELARLAGVGKTSVFDIEHGKQTIQLNTLNKILTVLNITVELKSPLMKTMGKTQHENR